MGVRIKRINQSVSCSNVFIEFITIRSSGARLPGFKSQLYHVLGVGFPLCLFLIIEWR